MAFVLPATALAAFPPAPERLLNTLRAQVDDPLLMQIANADYGEGADECFGTLKIIRDTGEMPPQSSGNLWNVLELTRWYDPERADPSFDRSLTGRRAHLAQLFACAMLLRLDSHDSEDSTLAQALKCTSYLGEELTAAFASHLTSRILIKRPEYPDSLFRALSLLICAIRLKEHTPHRLAAEIADWVLAEESRLLQRMRGNDLGERCPPAFSLLQGLWTPLLAELSSEAARMPPGDDRSNLELCAILFPTTA
jgi:hypothetical protein